MYIYESHLGGIYSSDDLIDYDYLYCEECGDSDRLIGKYDTIQEFLKDYADEINLDNSGGYDLESLIDELFELGTIDIDIAREIVRANKKMQKQIL
jgi:hypothetical protein